eukprot:TRINITY_DN1410_c0_g1_i1.p1 TRINITY_DN1410_c0_g1~~TRINITY_DN1410_c0_g1_i1.p1  ORF type:complete len:111 (-),score=13.76 TRINITY_DN1410_c0_g1_i1:25-357(-)
MDYPTQDNGACWAFYDLKTSKSLAGGTESNNVQIKWDGGLRISCYEDDSNPDVCAAGCEFQIWSDPFSYIQTFNCVEDTTEGGLYTFYTDCARLCGDVGPCPLFPSQKCD